MIIYILLKWTVVHQLTQALVCAETVSGGGGGVTSGGQLEADIEVFIQMEHCGAPTAQRAALEPLRSNPSCARTPAARQSAPPCSRACSHVRVPLPSLPDSIPLMHKERTPARLHAQQRRSRAPGAGFAQAL